MESTYDVVVVGGGAAGLAGAVTLSRARRSVLVVDAGEPRNATAGHVHNYFGREGSTPAELLASGRTEVEQYGGRICNGRVASAEAVGDDSEPGFRVVLDDGREVLSRRLLVTTGLTDELPDVPGLRERWGRDVLHCPYCHGWEVRDQAIGVLATGPMFLHQVTLFRQLSADVTLFLHKRGEPTADEAEQLAARGIEVVEGRVVGLELTDDKLSGVRLETGQVVPRQALVVAPRFTANADLLEQLGLARSELVVEGHVLGTYVAADPTGATAVRGVWVAGNVANLQAQVITSAAAGLTAGAMINADLVAAETRTAVAAYRGLREPVVASRR